MNPSSAIYEANTEIRATNGEKKKKKLFQAKFSLALRGGRAHVKPWPDTYIMAG